MAKCDLAMQYLNTWHWTLVLLAHLRPFEWTVGYKVSDRFDHGQLIYTDIDSSDSVNRLYRANRQHKPDAFRVAGLGNTRHLMPPIKCIFMVQDNQQSCQEWIAGPWCPESSPGFWTDMSKTNQFEELCSLFWFKYEPKASWCERDAGFCKVGIVLLPKKYKSMKRIIWKRT